MNPDPSSRIEGTFYKATNIPDKILVSGMPSRICSIVEATLLNQIYNRRRLYYLANSITRAKTLT